MTRRSRLQVLGLAALLLAPLLGCGGGTDGAEQASDYLYSCSLQVTNGTTKRIASFEWALVERLGGGDRLWGASGRNPNELWNPGLELMIVIGPTYAEPSDPSFLEWRVTFVDVEDVRYGPWTVPLSECGSTAFTITPADAIPD